MRGPVVALFFLLVALAPPAAAQGSAALTPSTSFATWQPVASSSGLAALRANVRAETQRTHWVRGGLIGAGIGAVAFGVVGAVACSSGDDDSCTGITIGSAALGAGVGFLTGALIGGAFAKTGQVATAR
jgi:hypothetical protein